MIRAAIPLLYRLGYGDKDVPSFLSLLRGRVLGGELGGGWGGHAAWSSRVRVAACFVEFEGLWPRNPKP